MNPQTWPQRRQNILAAMQRVMGELPDSSRRVPPAMEVLSEERLPEFTRYKVLFSVEAGDRLPAYLLVPGGLKAKAPAILCLHQTTPSGKAEPAGVDGKPELQYAAHLARRGYVTLAPDYAGGLDVARFGEYATNPYKQGYASATMKGIWNHMRAVDLLQSLPEVDASRIGCIGHSLGGHNALFLAAFDQRIKAVVSNCGFTSFAKYMNGDLTGWSHAGYMPRIASVYDRDPAKMPFDFADIIALIAPRAFLAVAPVRDSNFDVSGVRDCMSDAGDIFKMLQAGEKLQAYYPDAAHEFPEDSRQLAYRWFDKWLDHKPSAAQTSSE